MNKYLLTTVCDNGYALGAQVMIYSISKNLKNKRGVLKFLLK